MYSIYSVFHVLMPQWRHKSIRYQVYLQSKGRIGAIPRSVWSGKSESSNTLPIQSSLGYDPSDELFGVDFNPRKTGSDLQVPRSWFGPNGQYIRELPCPSCRGRGYTPCKECGIERSRQDCPLCSGKGTMTCRRCSGECVIWEESIDERPWEKAQSISPFRMKEDDEVDNLEIEFSAKRKSKRIYQSPPPEVGQKISRSLKSLNAKTGLFSKRMKIIHRNPTLQAQRIAAIKKAKGTAAARKRASDSMKAFFSDPENRRQRSFAMKGVKFFCKNCGQEGHRRHYCPNLGGLADRRFKCRVCGGKGHNRRTCPNFKQTIAEVTIRRHHHCTHCSLTGHNRRTCPKLIGTEAVSFKNGEKEEKGHKRRTERTITRQPNCRICGFTGHNRRTCPKLIGMGSVSPISEEGQSGLEISGPSDVRVGFTDKGK